MGTVQEAAKQCDELTGRLPSSYISVVNPIKSWDELNAKSSQEEKAASPVGLRFNSGKVRWDLIDPVAVEGVAKVLGFGAEKYTAENWRKGLSWKATLRSLESHLQALKRGEDIDSESGLPHIDHLGCNWMFLSNYQKMGVGKDDRVKLKSATENIADVIDTILAKRMEEWKKQILK